MFDSDSISLFSTIVYSTFFSVEMDIECLTIILNICIVIVNFTHSIEFYQFCSNWLTDTCSISSIETACSNLNFQLSSWLSFLIFPTGHI